MNIRIPFAVALALAIAPASLEGCFQEIDSAVVGGPVAGDSRLDDGGGPGWTLPPPFGDADIAQQCEAGSPLCYQLCSSPSCAMRDHSIPAEVATPAIVLPDGGVTDDACEQIRAMALQIREQSCAECHGPPPAIGFSGFDFVLDDQALVTQVPQTVTMPLVVPGRSAASVLMQRMALGLTGAQTGMPPPFSIASNVAGAAVASRVVYPTAADLSVIEAWITNCVPGTDGGAYSSNYYGGNHGPDASSPAAL